MPLSRRRLLRSSAAFLAACGAPGTGDSARSGDSASAPRPAPARSEEPAPWDAPGTLDEASFACGMQVGDATADAALASVRTAEPTLELVLLRADGDGWAEVSRTPASTQDGGVQQALSGLDPDTAYTACFYAADGDRHCAPTRFRTAPAVGTARVVTFGVTSCLGSNRPWPNMSYVAARDPDFFALLGDTVYADGAETLEDYRAFWQEALSTGGLRDVCASTSVVATWDDHEVANDWSPEDAEHAALAEHARVAFRESLPIAGASIWRSLRWGDTLELFVLDCRGERTDGNYISVAQMEWLKAGLAASDARFKLILNSVPVTDFAGSALDDILGDERWQGFPTQRQEILSFIHDEQIGGVLWIAGDLHFALLTRVDADSPDWEVLAGPAGNFLNPIVEALTDPDRFPVAVNQFNSVHFTADPGVGTVYVEWIGDDGSLLADATLEL